MCSYCQSCSSPRGKYEGSPVEPDVHEIVVSRPMSPRGSRSSMACVFMYVFLSGMGSFLKSAMVRARAPAAPFCARKSRYPETFFFTKAKNLRTARSPVFSQYKARLDRMFAMVFCVTFTAFKNYNADIFILLNI